jgi:hypothetical protein
MKTAVEIADLKKQWLHDPCWDIETTEGFEEHIEELKVYREQIEAENTARFEAEESARKVKTLVQTVFCEYANTYNADKELQQHIEKGWRISRVDHVTFTDNTGDWAVIVIKRIILLER